MEDVLLKNLHCLIADDEPMILMGLEEMLHQLGVKHVTRARSGAKVLSELQNADNPVDCILCDLHMPDGNGLQVLKAIRTGQIKSRRMDMCFIMVTGMTERPLIEAAKNLDANGYLVKPIEPEKLRSAIIRGRQRHFPVALERYNMVKVP